MKNICFVLTSMKSGGLQRNASILANHFSSKGNKVYICCIYSTENFFKLNDDVEVIDCSTHKNKFLSVGDWNKKLRKVFKEKNIDAVVSFGERCGMLAAKAVKKTNIKHICRGVNTTTTLLNKNLLRFSLRNIDTFVFQTRAQQMLYCKKIREKGIVIPNPFILQDKNLNTSGVDSKRFITVAAFKLKQKRQDVMIKAFALFSKNHPDYVFELYGECEPYIEKQMKKLINELGLNDKVKIMGENKEIKEQLAPCRAFICASTSEGMPNALIEALSYGVPVITSNWVGYDEMIIDRVNGIVFQMNNIEQLAYRMELIASDDKLFNEMSNNCWKYKIDSFESSKVLSIWDTLI